VVDLHVHVLPGLDDGPGTLDEAVEMCRTAAEDGIAVLVASPHMYNGCFDVARRDVLAGVASLEAALEEAGVSVSIVPAAELGLNEDLARLIREGEAVTLGEGDRYVLVELGPYDTMAAAVRILHEVQLAGPTPILIHPERNLEVQCNPDALMPAILAGNLVQCTAGSLTGYFGKAARRCVGELLQRGMVHVIASDAHDAVRRRPVLSPARDIVRRLRGEDEARRLFEENPRRLLDGRPVEVPAPVRKPAGRFRELLGAWWKP